MIKEELIKDGTLIRHWSDKYLMMLQNETGIKYGETIDIVPCPYTYSEIANEYIYPQWDENEEYNIDDRVIYQSGAFKSLKDNNKEVPADGEFWQAL